MRGWSVILLILAQLLSGCAALESIDRGLYTTAEAITERDKITGLKTISLQDRQQQIKEGNNAIQEFLSKSQQAGRRTDAAYDQIAYERIKRIFNAIHKVSHLSNESWAPVLLEDNSFNAFTTGGTYIVIHSGLEADLQDDSELANVIAHEIGHVVANHAFERRSYTTLHTIAGSDSAQRSTFQAAFTHENEIEADKLAVLYCALAGFDPYAGARIWQRMHGRYGSNASIVHDHPMNSQRAELATRIATLAEKYYKPGLINDAHEAILKNNDVFGSASKSNVEPGKGGGVVALLETVLTTMQQRNEAKREERNQQLRIQFMEAIESSSRILESSAISRNGWRVTVRYLGNLPLTDLGFKLYIKRQGQEPLVITRQISGILRPNTTFKVIFESPEFDAYKTNRRNVIFKYDEASTI